jgi:hypothetical protein
VRVYYGPPVDLSAYYGLPINRKILEEVTAFLMERVGALRPGGWAKNMIPQQPGRLP